MKIKNFIAVGAVATMLALTGCTSSADRASENISKSAENFEVMRRISVINGITDQVLFTVEGRCSIEIPTGTVVMTCKQGPEDIRKHYIGVSDNVTYVAEQLEPAEADEYRFRIILKPENAIPNFDLETSLDD